jgi:hypothetical protein
MSLADDVDKGWSISHCHGWLLSVGTQRPLGGDVVVVELLVDVVDDVVEDDVVEDVVEDDAVVDDVAVDVVVDGAVKVVEGREPGPPAVVVDA